MTPRQTTAIAFRTRFTWWVSAVVTSILCFWWFFNDIWGIIVALTLMHLFTGQQGMEELPFAASLALMPIVAFLTSSAVTWPLLLPRRLDVFGVASLIAWLPVITIWIGPNTAINAVPVLSFGFSGYWFSVLCLYLLYRYLERHVSKYSTKRKRYATGAVLSFVLMFVLAPLGEGLFWILAFTVGELTNSYFYVMLVLAGLPPLISLLLIVYYWYRRWLSSSKPAR